MGLDTAIRMRRVPEKTQGCRRNGKGFTDTTRPKGEKALTNWSSVTRGGIRYTKTDMSLSKATIGVKWIPSMSIPAVITELAAGTKENSRRNRRLVVAWTVWTVVGSRAAVIFAANSSVLHD